MKRVWFIAVLSVCRLYASAQNIEFAEISFFQDSVNPMTIHLVCKAKCAMYTAYARDAETIYWGDGTQSLVGLADTSYAYPGLIASDPLKTYKISHTYTSTFADSTIYIGLYMQDGLYEYLADAINDPAGMPLCPIATINFAYMKNHTGISPPRFSSYYTFVTDTMFRIFDFYPQIIYDSSYTLNVQNVPAIIIYPNGSAGGILPPNLYHPGPTNVITCDSSDGHLIWNYPHGYGGFLFSYIAAIYKNDTFVCSMTRDFMVDILDTAVSTSIIAVAGGSHSLRCYPSPTSGAFTIDMRGFAPDDKVINIYDEIGQIVYSTHTNNDQIQINMPHSIGGLYLVEVTEGSERDVAKIIITNN